MAIRLFQQAADVGDSAAMNSLAVLYDRGKDVTPDGVLAADWAMRAVGAGNGRTLKEIIAEGNDKWSPAFRSALESDLKQKSLYAGPIDGQITPSVVAALHSLAGK